MQKILFFLLLSTHTLYFAQLYKPLDTIDKPKREAFINQYKANSDLFIKKMRAKYSGKVRRELEKSHKDFQTALVKKIRERLFSFEPKFIYKINEIISEIRNKNNMSGEVRVLVAKDNSPNAFCTDDGTFVINMGLFYFLDNEDQLAGILSHELGHYALAHPLKSELKVINEDLINKTEIRKIKAQKYNRREKALDLFRSRMYDIGNYRRKYEFQADSLGYTLIKKTKYNKASFVKALELIGKYDTLKSHGLKVANYKKFFTLPNRAFKDKWLKTEDFSRYDYSLYKDKLNKDSIASHPEIVSRVKKLKQLFPELKVNSKEVVSTASYRELEKIADYERVPNFYANEEYGLGVYLCLLNLQIEKDPAYYKKWLGICLSKIYEARKNYTLNRYLDRVDPKEQSKSYQQYLSFMWNLNLEDIKAFTDYYHKEGS